MMYCAETIAETLQVGEATGLRIVKEIAGNASGWSTEITEEQLSAWIETKKDNSSALRKRIAEMEAYALIGSMTARALRYSAGKMKRGEHPPVGFVYICRSALGDSVKVGFTNHPIRRIVEHQVTHGWLHPLLIVCANPELERDLHRLFKKYRIAQEWFRSSRKLLAFVKWLSSELDTVAS